MGLGNCLASILCKGGLGMSEDKRDWVGWCFFCGKKIQGKDMVAPSGHTAHEACIPHPRLKGIWIKDE